MKLRNCCASFKSNINRLIPKNIFSKIGDYTTIKSKLDVTFDNGLKNELLNELKNIIYSNSKLDITIPKLADFVASKINQDFELLKNVSDEIYNSCKNNSRKQIIVITGGPCAGKSTICNKLLENYKYSIEIIPEAAALLIERDALKLTNNSKEIFQKGIYILQALMESAFFSKDTKAIFAIADRGSCDGEAYWPNKNFYKNLHTEKKYELSKYKMVLFIDSLSVSNKDLYVNSQIRAEDFETASKINKRLFEIWSEHENFVYLNNGSFPTLDEVYKKAKENLDKFFNSL